MAYAKYTINLKYNLFFTNTEDVRSINKDILNVNKIIDCEIWDITLNQEELNMDSDSDYNGSIEEEKIPLEKLFNFLDDVIECQSMNWKVNIKLLILLL